MQTDLGGVDIELFDTQASVTVDNFLNYVNDGDFNGTFFHRSVTGFILQAGGYIFNPDNGSLLISEGPAPLGEGGSHIPEDGMIENEADIINRPNARGWLSMARLPGQADSAGSDWFINLTDNVSLDNPAGAEEPFTAFGRVLGNGMDIIDAIATQNPAIARARCGDLLALPVLCGPGNNSTLYVELPLVGMSSASFTTLIDNVTFTPVIHQYNLINLLHIGSDTDGDGIADTLEDEGANNGDVNNDGTPDRDQQDIASYRAISDNLITLEAEAGVVLESTSFMGKTFGYSTHNPITPPAAIDGFNFLNGHLGFTLNNVTDTGGKTTVDITGMEAGCGTSSYFQYGPTPDDDTLHWYEFNYDEATDTGAEVNGDVITLHFVDGERGDAALDVAGVIENLGGFASLPVGDPDSDGLPVFIEDAAPNGGDGNEDGICDSVQDNVGSFPGTRNEYITIVAPDGFSLSSIAVFSAAELLVGQDVSSLTGVNLAYDFLRFIVGGLANPGDSVDVRVILPENDFPVSYFMFGPTPDLLEDHLYEFLFDGTTGAEFSGNEVILHFVDGQRGDFDVTANGEILDPGAPALFAATVAPNTGGGGGGGCALAGEAGRPGQAGAWMLLLLLNVLYGLRRYHFRMHV